MKEIVFASIFSTTFFLGSWSACAQEAPSVMVIPLFDDRTGDATAANVRSGQTFSNRDSAGISGTMPDNGAVNIMPGSASQVIAEGYHNGTGNVAGDADLVSGNIRSGVTLFGVTGTFGSSHPAPVSRSGQITSYSVGDDGDLENGVAWPTPRFTDNGNGTVTDNLTGLVWLKSANCASTAMNWSDALIFTNNLRDGWTGDPTGSDCGLSDGSATGDWRLPNRKEMFSLIDNGHYAPTLSDAVGTAGWSEGDAFTNVQNSYYWSSTSYAGNTDLAWYVLLTYGLSQKWSKSNYSHVWPVRGEQ